MKDFLYSIFGLLIFLSFSREKEIIHTSEFIYSEVYEENYAEIEIDETPCFSLLGEGHISPSHGKSRRTVSAFSKVSFVSQYCYYKDSWFAQVRLLVDVKYKSITQTLFYKSTYHRLYLFLFILV